MKLHKDSHLDHALTEAQIAFLVSQFADRDAFFIETVELPEALGTVPCGLYGPLMGDAPVPSAVHAGCGWCHPCMWFMSGALCSNPTNSNNGAYEMRRGERQYASRVVDRPMRQVRTVTVIAGPHEETCPLCNGEGQFGSWKAATPCSCNGGKVKHACILYTAFGGPCAPQEPGDPTCKDRAKSEEFWNVHALASGK